MGYQMISALSQPCSLPRDPHYLTHVRPYVVVYMRRTDGHPFKPDIPHVECSKLQRLKRMCPLLSKSECMEEAVVVYAPVILYNIVPNDKGIIRT